jgi:guanine nucleotide-binding protein alpha-1 subunit
MGIMFDANDPLSVAMAPPPGETPEERAQREKSEADAQRVSDSIDEDIKKSRIALKKAKNVVRVLLLGQSESGRCISFHAICFSQFVQANQQH